MTKKIALMRHPKTTLTPIAIVLVLVGCTDRDIGPIADKPPAPFDNKLRLEGKVCTEDPSDLDFPLKVLFIIDTSQSMDDNDPKRTTPDPKLGETTVVDPTQATGRSRAVRQVISQFVDLGLSYPGQGCNTSSANCTPGNSACADCTSLGTPAICTGGPCCTCQGTDCANCQVSDDPICPVPGEFNGICLPLCDSSKAGCGPGERPCPDCANASSFCLSGVCSALLDPGVEFAIMRFGSARQVVTRDRNGQQGFTNDPGQLVAALPQINNAGSITDYEGALAEAFATLSEDMKAMERDNTGALTRSKYVVIFLSDGTPFPEIESEDDWERVDDRLIGAGKLLDGAPIDRFPRYNVDDRIKQRIQDIMTLRATHHIGEITMHTAYLSNPITPPREQKKAVDLLKEMAALGGGTFRNFQNGEEINFLHVDFSSLRRVFTLKNLIVTNLNGIPDGLQTVLDSDADGLSDPVEREAGTNVASSDSDQDGFSDTVEYFFRDSGADALDPTDADCSQATLDTDSDGVPDTPADKDGDGLLDCEERFLGTNKELFDSDADGVPDNVEVRFGTNPVANDSLNDLDFDGMPNGDEVRLHTDPSADDAAHRSRVSYRYDVQRVGSGREMIGETCAKQEDCPQATGCVEGYCRCLQDTDCSSLTDCNDSTECVRHGEECIERKCTSKQVCQELDDAPGEELTCGQEKSVTCYDYSVENITLVSPTGQTADGWNTLHLYFGQVPFDNPNDFGVYSLACVKARFDDETGAKLPSRGSLEIPQAAWKPPQDFDFKQGCLCPDGSIGDCEAQ